MSRQEMEQKNGFNLRNPKDLDDEALFRLINYYRKNKGLSRNNYNLLWGEYKRRCRMEETDKRWKESATTTTFLSEWEEFCDKEG